jgi:hypothetical protein
MDPIPQVFVPGQQPFYKAQDPFISVVVRTAGDPAALAKAVQASIWTVDKDQPVSNLQPMAQVLWESAAASRAYMLLLGIFATIALVIASAGIYGLSAYAVVRRTQEIGIRLALGATSRQILVLILRLGMALTVIGVAIGMAASLGLTKVISGFCTESRRPMLPRCWRSSCCSRVSRSFPRTSRHAEQRGSIRRWPFGTSDLAAAAHAAPCHDVRFWPVSAPRPAVS